MDRSKPTGGGDAETELRTSDARPSGTLAPDRSVPPSSSAPERPDLQARQLLDRIVRGVGYGWRDIERHLHEHGGPGEGPPLGDLLRDLDVMDLERDNFFEVLVPRFDKARFEHPIERDVADLLQELGAPEPPAEVTLGSTEPEATLARTLDRIDRGVLDLIERTLGETVSPMAHDRPKQAAAASDDRSTSDGGADRTT